MAQSAARAHAEKLRKIAKTIARDMRLRDAESMQGISDKTSRIARKCREAARALRGMDAEMQIVAREELEGDKFEEELRQHALLCPVSNFPLRDAMRMSGGVVLSKEGAMLYNVGAG